MRPHWLEQLGGPHRFPLRPGRRVVLGRAPENELVVAHPSVSRRHAELELTAAGLAVKDLESANGTRVNGERQEEAVLLPGDQVTFGSIEFRLVASPEATVADALPAGTAIRTVTEMPATTGHLRSGRAVEQLLHAAAGLSGDFALDELLTAVVDLAFEQVDADRVAVLLARPGEAGLVPAAARSSVGDGAPAVPRAIVDRALVERAAVITESATEDARFQSGSVLLQAVRSALCVPLLADGQVLGALYADTITRSVPFDEDEARALQAFAGLAAVAIGRVRFAEEARREREVRANFERFFAPGVAAAIASGQGRVSLGGARLPVAVLFSDIRGFTGLAERLSPEALAVLLGDYYALVVDAVFEHGGTLDRFIGDAVLAAWGAPLPSPDSADRAARTARAIRDELATRNARRQAAGEPVIEVGFGLSYGDVFAGNIGTERRLEYTVLGDPVNVARRLCDLAGPGEILVAEELAGRLTDRGWLEPAQSVTVRGRTQPVRVFRGGA